MRFIYYISWPSGAPEDFSYLLESSWLKLSDHFLTIAEALVVNWTHLFTVCSTYFLKTELSGLARKSPWA